MLTHTKLHIYDFDNIFLLHTSLSCLLMRLKSQTLLPAVAYFFQASVPFGTYRTFALFWLLWRA